MQTKIECFGMLFTWRLDRCHLEPDLEPVDDEGGEGLAVNVLGDDDQGTLGLD